MHNIFFVISTSINEGNYLGNLNVLIATVVVCPEVITDLLT